VGVCRVSSGDSLVKEFIISLSKMKKTWKRYYKDTFKPQIKNEEVNLALK